jgi:hypothetical protein
MQTPEHHLSSTERRLLQAIGAGNPNEATPDFVAFQRLKAFGLISVAPGGRPSKPLKAGGPCITRNPKL